MYCWFTETNAHLLNHLLEMDRAYMCWYLKEMCNAEMIMDYFYHRSTKRSSPEQSTFCRVK